MTDLALQDSLIGADFEAAVIELRPSLVRRLTLVLGDRDEAEDIAQDTCLRALRSRGGFGGGDLGAWLHVIGFRLALNELRRRRRAMQALLRLRLAGRTVPSTDIELWDTLRQLRPRERAALLLNVLDGYSYAEIGAMLGAREGTVGSWISRAKDRIRADLSKERNDDV